MLTPQTAQNTASVSAFGKNVNIIIARQTDRDIRESNKVKSHLQSLVCQFKNINSMCNATLFVFEY